MPSVPTLTFKKMWNHFRTIQKHRKWVRHYCFLAGIPWRGITHDLSKYNPIEFFESARYWTGKESPITLAKKEQGYSRAWLHHRGHNPHHWAYWADNFSEGLTVPVMPKNDFVEMICDFLAAGHTYNNSFSYSKENSWWLKDREKGCKAMNPINKKMIDIIFCDLEEAEAIAEKYPTDKLVTPEHLIKNKYIQYVYERNVR